MKTSSISLKSKSIMALLTVLLSSSLLLSGCQTVKGWLAQRDDGSLRYQDSDKLAPLELPISQETAAFIPLYPTPNAGANTVDLINDAGKQYELPAPERAVAISPETP